MKKAERDVQEAKGNRDYGGQGQEAYDPWDEIEEGAMSESRGRG